jgi:hypothetical protein
MEANLMDQSAGDVSQTVAYSTDKWLIDKVPWALWCIVPGLAIVLHAETRGENGAALAVVYLALLALACTGYIIVSLIGRSGISVFLELPIWFLVFIVVALVSTVIVAAIGGSIPSNTRSFSDAQRFGAFFDPPLHVGGWMLIYLGLGWIAFAGFRHVYPARPIVMLSTAGIAYHRAWLPNLFIPWQDVHGVGPLDISDMRGPGATNPQVTAVVVEKDFYERHIAPKRGFFEPPGTDYMFRPKGDEYMQMAVNSTEVAVIPEDYRVPIEARWKAFRDRPMASVPQTGELSDPSIVYGRWSVEGTWWQAVKFLTPLVAMFAVVLHATAIR